MNASPMLEDKPAPASPLRGGAGDDKNGGQTATTPQSKTKTAPSRGASPSIATPAARASSSRATQTKPEPASPPEAKATEEKKKRGRPAAAKKATEEEKGKGKAAAPKSKAAEGKKNKEATIPGWNIDGEILWKVYGDVSKMPKTDSIVVVSLNDGVIQTGDAWRRSQGYAPADAEDWIWWSAACVPALRAIATGSAGASAFSPEGGAGLAAAMPKGKRFFLFGVFSEL